MTSSDSRTLKGVPTEEHSSESGQKALKSDTKPVKDLRVFDITQQPQSFKNPASIPGSPPTVTYPPGLLDPVVPASSFSSPRDFSRNPYTETGYTPKRFRPEEYEKESPGDDELINSAISSSRAWLPPEHLDELLEGEDTPTSPTPVRDFSFMWYYTDGLLGNSSCGLPMTILER